MLKFLLFPFAALYDLVTRIRNTMYDRGLKPSVSFEAPVVSVGNLTVGGTGKTPMIEYLIRLLKKEFTVAVISRGYGRKTKGFRLVSGQETPATVGDEPFQYYRKFRNEVTVAVGEERALAIPLVFHTNEDINVILLDDAFQHRRVRPSLSILLSDYSRPFYQDWLMPMGRLRESAEEAERADCVVITKCPSHLTEDEFANISQNVRLFTEKPLFFTAVSYGNPVGFGKIGASLNDKVILVTGIAHTNALVEFVTKHYTLVEHLDYPDHYSYGAKDFQRFAVMASSHPDAVFMTTEKDMVKLDMPGTKPYLEKIPFFYLPITVQFLKNETEFREIVVEHVRKMAEKIVV